MKKINYCRSIFGGEDTVKRLIVREIRHARMKQGLSPEDLDALLGLNADFPGMRELEANPYLFHPEVLDMISFMVMVRDGDGFDSCCSCLDARIRSFLDQPHNFKQVLRECLSGHCPGHMTIWPENMPEPDEFFQNVVRKICAECPENWLEGMDRGSQNGHAMTHVFFCIMEELKIITARE